jgi:hypothetical protein
MSIITHVGRVLLLRPPAIEVLVGVCRYLAVELELAVSYADLKFLHLLLPIEQCLV